MKKGPKYYYILIHPTAVFVKTEQFFIDQGGQSAEWGKAWRKIDAESIDNARAKGVRLGQELGIITSAYSSIG